MRLPWHKPKNGLERSQRAVIDATKSLQDVRALGAEVSGVSEALKKIRERNHFAEQLTSLMGGR